MSGSLMTSNDNGDRAHLSRGGWLALVVLVGFLGMSIWYAAYSWNAIGVTFQDYDLPDLKTENHICTTDSEKCAWFMDSEHNILCVHENITTVADYQL